MSATATKCLASRLNRRAVSSMLSTNHHHHPTRSFSNSKSPSSDDPASTTTSQQQQEQRPMDMAYAPVNDFFMNQYAVACTASERAVLIDCGASTTEQLDGFLQWLAQPQHAYTLTAIWQTHAHLDHVAGLGLVRQQYPDIPIHLHRAEVSIYESFAQRSQDFGLEVEDPNLPPTDTLTLFDGTTTKSLKCGKLKFHIVDCPGHSPGHVGFYEPKSQSFFGGDFIMQGAVGRTDFPTSNPTDMNMSLEQFVQTMPDAVTIFPGHGPPTTLKQEKQTNPFLQAYANNWGGV
eukprot:scaffold1600_cov179-Amphora_coffeaeformis.AAC.7